MIPGRDKLILKFAFYGFFKNLKFFEPFLYVFFLERGFTFLEIGMLISGREIVKNIFEIPSGIFADNYGRKKTLQICFILYIISFVIFYYGNLFITILLAMFFFGLGEAFRSGTHKAIIFTYLDQNDLTDKKVEVYGYTKSYSLIGSALSAVLGVLIIFINSNFRLIFLFSTIPYIIDFFLINSYPDYLDQAIKGRVNLKIFWLSAKKSIINLKEIINLRRGLINSSIYDGFLKVLQDYLQPILKSQVMVVPLLVFIQSEEKRLSILLGFSYFFIYLLSSLSSRNSYKVRSYFAEQTYFLNLLFFITAILLSATGLFAHLKLTLLLILLFIFLYIISHIRRPVMLNYLAAVIDKKERATMLSVESQLKTVIIILLAPLLGAIADHWGIWVMFEIASISLFLVFTLTKISDSGSKAQTY